MPACRQTGYEGYSMWTELVKVSVPSSGNNSKSSSVQNALSNSPVDEGMEGLLLYRPRVLNSRLEKVLVMSRISWLVVVGFMSFAFVPPKYYTTKRVYN